MAAKRERFSYNRGLSASNVTASEQPLKRPKTSHSWVREEGHLKTHSGPKADKARSFTWIAADAASSLPPAEPQSQIGSVSESAYSEAPRQATPPPARLTTASAPQAAPQLIPQTPSHLDPRAQTFKRRPSGAARKVAARNATASPGRRGPAAQSYAKNRPNQLLRVSPGGAGGPSPVQRQPAQTPARRPCADAIVRVATIRPLASLVHKSKHSLVRRPSIVLAAARTVAAARSPRPGQPSLQWVRRGVGVAANSPPKSSRFKPQPRKGFQRASPPGAAQRQRGAEGSLQWQRGVGARGYSPGGAFQWQRGMAKRAIRTPAPVTARLAQQRSAARPQQLRFVARPGVGSGKVAGAKKPPGKLVRIGGSLYRVSGTGGGRSLKRQVTPKVVPRAPGQAARYKRQGNSLCRMLGTPTPRPRSATRVKQQSVRQHKTKVPASGTLPRGPNSVGFRGKGGLKLGMIAKIRRSSKFVNQTCFTFCKTGKCAEKEEGACPLVHEPKNVAICPQWLQGRCDKADCSLQHKRRTALMPQCMHFLTGTCTALECAYLHVMLDEKAPVCKDFQRGYCSKGASCLQKHLTSKQLHHLRASKPTSWVAPKPQQEGPRKKRRQWPLPFEESEERPAKHGSKEEDVVS